MSFKRKSNRKNPTNHNGIRRKKTRVDLRGGRLSKGNLQGNHRTMKKGCQANQKGK